MTPTQLKWLLIDKWFITLPILVLILCFLMWLFTPQGPDKKSEQIKANIAEQRGEANVIEVQRNTAIKDVENQANNTNRDINDLRNSRDRDSRTFNGSSAGKRFCDLFPEDSTCRK